ncbi:alpha-2-macroglobulin family protein [Pontibacter virosus]|uniref:Bacterial alpha-2-macroglobulin MG10 domain-containing protein n=1 Tax=Pontibacter virosus TaxID=1765052 RepID=A0A2U1AUV9_9BACT|nr:hypothetical protein C8E01_10874 [Pontibacter virosus]
MCFLKYFSCLVTNSYSLISGPTTKCYHKPSRGPYEVYREYFRHKVAIFADRLPKGKHTYSIQPLPRYIGVYTLNPAKAELIYFPVFYGRIGLKDVRIK